MKNMLFSPDHEWLKIEEPNSYIMGITDYAQKQLGDVVFVELPQAGDEFSKGQVLGTVESVKSVSDIYAPVSLRVVQINTSLQTKPEKVNQDCYEEGWLIKLTPTKPAELEDLLAEEAYTKIMV